MSLKSVRRARSARPSAVPATTARITAGMFCISGTELIPMPMAHTPNTLLSSVVKRVESFLLNTVPRTPPSATASTLTITPIIFLSS